MNVDLSVGTIGRLKTMAKLEGLTMKKLVAFIVEDFVQKFKVLKPKKEQVRGPSKGNSTRLQKKLVFIRKNLELSDDELASALDLSVVTVHNYRLRAKKLDSSLFEEVAALMDLENSFVAEGSVSEEKDHKILNEKQKKYIVDNLSVRNGDIATDIGLRIKTVIDYKVSLLGEYLKGEGATLTVSELSRKFAFTKEIVSGLRLDMGLTRVKVSSKFNPFSEYTAEQVKEILTKSGKTLIEWLNELELSGTRQNKCSLFDRQYGIKVSDLKRTPEWYIRRVFKDDPDTVRKFMDKEYIEFRLLSSQLSSLASEFGTNSARIREHVLNLGIDERLIMSDKRRQSFVCAKVGCDTVFSRTKTSVKRDLKRNPNKLFYCSRQCSGSVMGNEAGFVAHPENIPRKVKD
jgi:transcriptional regulator with XRE-family HTH domain